MNTTAISSAAAVTMRPVRSRPRATDVLVVAAAVVLLLDPGEEEHLVVHRQAEGDAEHEDRRGGVDRAGGREVEHARQVAVLEDPHHRPEGGGQAEQVEHQRLERHEHAAEHQEQQHEGDDGDDRRAASGQPAEQRRPCVSTSSADSPVDQHVERRGGGRGCPRPAASPSGDSGSTVGHDRQPGALSSLAKRLGRARSPTGMALRRRA